MLVFRKSQIPSELKKYFVPYTKLWLDVPKAGNTERDEGLINSPLKRAKVTDFQVESVKYRMENNKITNPKSITFRKNVHPTVKPVKLMGYLIELGCPSDGVVLDPFLGSGSTMKAAILTGKGCIGIEINPDYCKIARGRCFNQTRFHTEYQFTDYSHNR